MAKEKLASTGHKLGQLVGDWFEEYFVLPLLQKVADTLKLFLDHRFADRPARGDKIKWQDEEGNAVDYDFVMELDGTKESLGIPVAFFECFWRQGARHSKDKARDDSGKLLPMRQVHPTARFLGIIATGDSTAPARSLVQSRGIDLFYVPKAKIVSAFEQQQLTMDYPDRMLETKKAKLARAFEKNLTTDKKQLTASSLRDLIGTAILQNYSGRVRAALGALPQEIRFLAQRQSNPVVFESLSDATDFLNDPQFDFSTEAESFVYEITYSDGTDFERGALSLQELKDLHLAMERLANHVTRLAKA